MNDMVKTNRVGDIEEYVIFRAGDKYVGINPDGGDVEIFLKLSSSSNIVNFDDGTRTAYPIDEVFREAFALAVKVQRSLQDDEL